jgi:oligosaccharide repeat unit polymerase
MNYLIYPILLIFVMLDGAEESAGVVQNFSIVIGSYLLLLNVTSVMKYGYMYVLSKPNLVMQSVLYFLILFEFLFDQPKYSSMITIDGSKEAIYYIIFCFLTIDVIARLIIKKKLVSLLYNTNFNVKNLLWLNRIAILSFVIYVFPFLIASNFDIFSVLTEITKDRFSRATSRGALGAGILESLAALGDTRYVFAICSGLLFSRLHLIASGKKILLSVCVLFLLAETFFSGTRTVFLICIFSILISYVLGVNLQGRRLSLKFYVSVILVLIAGVISTQLMLNYRSGISLMSSGLYGFSDSSFFIDLNFLAISVIIMNVSTFGLLGGEHLILSILRFVPRVFWPDKPIATSVSVENLFGVYDGSVTISASYLGEAYLDFGFLGAIPYTFIIMSIYRIGLRIIAKNGDILTGIGFIVVAIFSMRSVAFTTTVLLPFVIIYLWRVIKIDRSRY